MGHEVFICHSSADKTVAYAACESLEGAGIRCWIAPRDPLPGLPYARQLVEAISQSRIVLLILSAHSNDSGPVLNELELASNRKKLILPVRIEEIVPSPNLEYYVRSMHWHDALSMPLETHWPVLVAQVRELLEASAGRASAAEAPADQSVNVSGSGRQTNNLPVPLTRFIGRDEELAALKTLLSASRLVTLVGTGGIGKTRLSLHVATELLPSFEDGGWLIELAPLRDAGQVPSALAGVVGVKESAEHPLTQSLLKFLHAKKLLLILDNCEHVVEGAATLSSAILRECAGVRILATSRQPLGISGEHPYRVSSLALPPPHATLSKEEAMQYGAIALFADRGHTATQSFELSDANVATVAQICRHLDGIALALELAAPRLKMLSLEQLNERLSERFRVLTGGSRDVLPRQQTLHALIDWSYDLLDEDEQRFFRRLCVFAGDFSLEAAGALGADEALDEWRSFELLSSLVDKSLVTSEPAEAQRRYSLLESMREYALEKAGDEVAALRLRHAEYYTALAERARAAYADTPSTDAWLRELDPELAQFRAVLEWTLGARANAQLGGRMVTALRRFFAATGLAAAASRWAQMALAEELTAPVQAALWLTLAIVRDFLMLPIPTQLEAASRARQLYETLEDRVGLAEALRHEGYAQFRLGAFSEGEVASQRALSLCRELGDRRAIAAILNNVAGGLMFAGQPAKAKAAMLEILDLVRQLGHERGVFIALMNLAEMEFQLGEIESAVARARENLEDDSTRADAALLSLQRSNLAAYLIALNRFDEARSQGLGALQIACDSGSNVRAAIALQHVGATLAHADPKRAGQLLGHVESVFTANGYVREYAERYTHDRLVSTLRETLSPDDITKLAHEGAALTEAQAAELTQ